MGRTQTWLVTTRSVVVDGGEAVTAISCLMRHLAEGSQCGSIGRPPRAIASDGRRLNGRRPCDTNNHLRVSSDVPASRLPQSL